MDEIKKAKVNSEVSDDDLSKVSGGYAVNDEDSDEEYGSVGVVHKNNIFSKDEYILNSPKITESDPVDVIGQEKKSNFR